MDNLPTLKKASKNLNLSSPSGLTAQSEISSKPEADKKIETYKMTAKPREKTSKNLKLSSPSGLTAQSTISSKPEAGSMEENKSKKDEDFKETVVEENTSKHGNVSPPVHHPKQPAISTDHGTENTSKHGNVSPPVDPLKELAISTDHGTENASKHGNVSPPVHHLKQPAIPSERETGSLEENKSKKDEDFKDTVVEENASKHGNVSPPVDHLKQLAISTDHGTENASKHGNVSPPVHHLKQPAIPSERETEKTLPKYKMDAKPRGICLIFNNVNFKTDEFKKRTGSDADRDALKKVFTSFHFEVTVFEDRTKTGMKEKLNEFASKDHTRYDCFVCCILSHGTKSKVYGVDGEGLDYETVISRFQSSKCNSLVGKPKLFFIQACQGESKMRGSKIEFDGSSPSSIPNVADFLMAYATFPGYVSIRNTMTGSWFIWNLCKVLNEYGRTTDLSDMLLLVNESVAKEEAQLGGVTCKQIPSLVSTLRKKLFFLDTL